MAFTRDAERLARNAMIRIRPALADKYALIVRLLAENSDLAPKLRGADPPPIGGPEYIDRQAIVFADSRDTKVPRVPTTVPDEMVSVILRERFEVREVDLERVKHEHLLSMGAENFVGELLERYLARMLEPLEWVWCSGSLVKSVDFVKPPGQAGEEWKLLQVKNRDNSENSSSSAIRIGTKIKKWHRSFSRKPGSNWDAFPDDDALLHVSEDAFREFVRDYLRALPR